MTQNLYGVLIEIDGESYAKVHHGIVDVDNGWPWPPEPQLRPWTKWPDGSIRVDLHGLTCRVMGLFVRGGDACMLPAPIFVQDGLFTMTPAQDRAMVEWVQTWIM